MVAVALTESPGVVVDRGAADATEEGMEDEADAAVAAAKDARCVFAFEPEASDVNPDTKGQAEVASLMHQLQEMSKEAERSVAAEIEAAAEDGDGLLDDAGRKRVLATCTDIREDYSAGVDA